MPSDVSVIVSNFNGARYLPRLLETLRAQRGVVTQLIVVDRRSTDGSLDLLEAASDVAVLTEPPETGLVTGYAAGARVATAPLLFFCNEDMWFDPDCLRRLADRVRSAPDVGAADPWQWTYDGRTLIHAVTRFRPAFCYQNSPDPSRRPDFEAPADDSPEVPFGCAGAVMVRREAYDAAGGWDTSFFLDLEDLDLFIRTWQLGWRVLVEPEARVYHAVSASNAQTLTGRVPVSRRRYVSGRASILVMAVKYLPAPAIAGVAVLWGAATLKRCLAPGEWRQLPWDLDAVREFGRRYPAARAYRASHREVNRRRPVSNFFRALNFQANRRKN